MKIAVSAEGPDVDARVGDRFGTSQYLVIVDLDSGDFEAVPNPGASGQRGAGMQAVVLSISKDVKAVLTGYCSPAVRSHLAASGIEVLTGLSGTVAEVVESFKKGDLREHIKAEIESESGKGRFDRAALVEALRSCGNQFGTLLPVLVGVVLLIGLFNVFVSQELVTSIFSGGPVLDTLWGACFGSILAGNPINSYVIGAELLNLGVSLFAVTAFIITWVTVGLVALPAEMAALGRKFAIVRNILCLVLALPITILTVVVVVNIVGR